MKTTRSWRGVAAICAVAALVTAAGCGNNTQSTTRTGGTATSTQSSATGPAHTSAAADPSLSPLKIGWVNLDVGTPSFPGMTRGADAAVQYINEKLGGVDGHPIELVDCQADATPETNQACGQQFANDKDVKVAVSGLLLAGAAYWDAMASSGKTTIGSTPITPADYATTNGYFMFGGGPVDTAMFVAGLELLGDKTVSIIYDSGPAGVPGLTNTTKLLDELGIPYEAIGIDASQSDVLAQVTEALSSSPDAVGIYVAAPACLAVGQALKTLGYQGDIGATIACYTKTTQDGFDFSNWYISGYTKSLEVPAGTDDDVDTYLHHYGSYSSSDPGEAFASVGWGTLITVHRILKDLNYDDLNNDTIKAAVSGYTGAVAFGPDKVTCPGPAAYPAVCGTSGRLYEVLKNGTVKIVDGADGIDIRTL